MSAKSPLGRGLSSLIPSKPRLQQEEVSHTPASINPNPFSQSIETERLILLPVDLIEPNPYQPRKAFDLEEIANLSKSIQEKGILQPLVVTFDQDKGYQLIAGERRLKAAKMAGIPEVPVVIRTNVTDQDKAELALIENIQRKDLNPIERALGYQDLAQKFSLTQEEIAQKLDVSRSSVANTLRYLSLPDSVKEALSKGVITEGHAKIIAGLDSPQLQEQILQNIVVNSLNVRQTEKVIKRDPKDLDTKISPEVKQWMSKLSDKIHNKVEVRKKGKRYIVTMNFFSEDEIAQFTRYFESKS